MILQLKKKKKEIHNPVFRKSKFFGFVQSISIQPKTIPIPSFFSLQKGNLSSLYQNLSFLLQLFLVVAECTGYLEFFFFFLKKT